MKIDVQTVLINIGGKPFMREEYPIDTNQKSTLLPMRLGDVLMEGLLLFDGKERRDAKENIRRSRLAERVYDAMLLNSGEIEVSNDDQKLMLDAVNAYLAHPRAVAEAIRIIDPVKYDEAI